MQVQPNKHWETIVAIEQQTRRKVTWWTYSLLVVTTILWFSSRMRDRNVGVQARWVDSGRVCLTPLCVAETPILLSTTLWGSSSDLSSELPVASIRLKHQTTQQISSRTAIGITEVGLGTAVGPHTILTHGHHRPFQDSHYTRETMAFERCVQGPFVSQRTNVADITTSYADEGTTLLILPGYLDLPDAAALGDPTRLRAGDPVFIVYWDDADGRFAAFKTAIVTIEGGVARIEDPEQVIGPGDSGGGVYNDRGELVGNIWSIGFSNTGQRLPWLEVALLPARIVQNMDRYGR